MKLRNFIGMAAWAVLAFGTAGSGAQAGQKQTLTYTKTEMRSAARSSFEAGDVPNHTISQEVQRHLPKFSDARFTPVEEWIQIQNDETDGTGTHRGSFIQFHAGGDRTYGTFEGRHVTTAKPDGAWSTRWEGSYRYLGGSGRYRAIKGEGTYTGRASPDEPFHEEGRETIEY